MAGVPRDVAALDRLRSTTGITGLAAAVVFATGNALWAFDQPSAGASASELVSFYSDNSTNIVIGGSLSLMAIALFVFFAAGLRALLQSLDVDDVLPSAALGGALLICAVGLGAESINMAAALRAGDGDLSPELARSLFEVSYVLGYNAAGVGLGVMLGATAGVALRSGRLMARPVAWLALVVAVAFCTPLVVVLLLPAVLLFAVASAMLLRPLAKDAAGG